MTIRELMTGGLITVRREAPVLEDRDLMAKERIRRLPIGPDRPAREGARLMLDHKIGALPVLDDGRLIGILTETDIVWAFVRTTAPGAPSATDAGGALPSAGCRRTTQGG